MIVFLQFSLVLSCSLLTNFFRGGFFKYEAYIAFAEAVEGKKGLWHN